MISGFDSSNTDLIFINSPWTADQDTILENIPGLIIQKNEESKNYGSITLEIYAVNKYKLHNNSNYNYAQLSNLCEIIINYNFCDYNVTLNGLPTSNNSSNPVINISGYVGVNYNNLFTLFPEIARNYEVLTHENNNSIYKEQYFTYNTNINNNNITLDLINNKLSRFSNTRNQ